MKKYQCISFLLSLLLIFSFTFTTYADLRDLMIATDSNALMTLELDDSDYSIMPMSSIGTVTNTIKSSKLVLYANVTSDNGSSSYVGVDAVLGSDGRYRFRLDAPSGKYIKSFFVRMFPDDLPRPGSYSFSFDLASDFAYEVNYMVLDTYQDHVNSTTQYVALTPPASFYSGDIYIAPYNLQLTNLNLFDIKANLKNSENVTSIAGSFAVRFAVTGSGDYPSTAGTNTSNEDYQSDISSSLSDLSSSVDSMTEDLSSAAENLEYISTSQNLIIQGIDNVVMHISDQLFAFWNQLFNLIHVPTMAKMDDIISAINNMDLEIEVNLDGLKTTINNMSTAVQNKLQSTTDKITGGYDNSGITQENEKLEQSINQYDEVESGIFEDAEGFIGDFEYPSVDSLPLGIIKALAFVGGFLQGVFLSMGEFSVIITFSLTMIFVMVVVGYHRIRS